MLISDGYGNFYSDPYGYKNLIVRQQEQSPTLLDVGKDIVKDYAKDKAMDYAKEYGADFLSAGNIAGAIAAAKGAYDTASSLDDGGKGLRSANSTLGGGAGMIIGGPLGAGIGAAIGNATGYLADKWDQDSNILKRAGIAVLNPVSALQGMLVDKNTKQHQQFRRDRLSEQEDNSYRNFAELNNNSSTQRQVSKNLEKAYQNTDDDYVGWYDDPNTTENEWAWVNKKTPSDNFQQNNINYQKTLGAGDIMWMPDFFENIPEWANLTMEQRDKIADKAIKLGTSQNGGLYGNKGDIDINDDIWKGELGEYAKQVIDGTDDSNSGSNMVTGKTNALSEINGRPIGVVGNIFYPGNGEPPVYIGNYNRASAIDNQIARARVMAGLNKSNAYADIFNDFAAPFLANDKKEKEPANLLDLANYYSILNQYTNPFQVTSLDQDIPDFDFRFTL